MPEAYPMKVHKSRLHRILKILSTAIVIVLVGSLAAYAILDRLLLNRFAAREAGIRAAGGFVSWNEVTLPALAPEDNAFTVYKTAAEALDQIPAPENSPDVLETVFEQCPKEGEEGYSLDMSQVAALARQLAPAQSVLQQVREAEQVPGFQIPYNFHPQAIAPVQAHDLQALSTLAKCLAAQACLESARGDRVSAWNWLETEARLINRLRGPRVLSVEVTRMGMGRTLLRAAKTVLAESGAPKDTLANFGKELALMCDRKELASAFESERAYSLDQYREKWEPTNGIQAYVSRPWLYRNKIALLDMYSELIPAVRSGETAAREAAYAELLRLSEDGPLLVAPIAVPTFTVAQSLDRLRGRSALLKLAMQLDCYCQEHSNFPERLENLALEGVASEGQDLYNDGTLEYEKEPDGATLTWDDSVFVARPGRSKDELRITWHLARKPV